MSVDAELRRLRGGPQEGEKPHGIGVVAFRALCDGNAETVLAKAKGVLELVLGYADTWPPGEGWRTLLPQWFVHECAPETSVKESEEWLAWWRTLPSEEQARVSEQKRWSLADWLYWFEPEQREWYWWDAVVVDSDTIQVEVVAEGWPFPWGSLKWLFRASGATDMIEDVGGADASLA